MKEIVVSRAPKPTFAERLAEACRYHPEAPAHYGQQAWVRRKLRDLGEEVSSTAVSNWFAGYTQARPDLAAKLAQILDRDVSWLTGADLKDGNLKSTGDGNAASGNGNRAINISTLEIPIPLRSGLIVRLQGVPADLSGAEAQKIANVILAFGAGED